MDKRKNRVYGYARISSSSQNIARQIQNLVDYCPDIRIYEETYTGRKIYGRKEFNKLLRVAGRGDTIVFDSVSRMSRDTEEGVEVYFNLYEKGVNLVFLNEPYINTAVYTEELNRKIDVEITTGLEETDVFLNGVMTEINKYMMALAKRQVVLAFEQAQKEADYISKSTKEGIREAKRRGKQIGHVPGTKLNVKRREPVKQQIRKYSKDFNGTLMDSEVMKLIDGGIARNTYYRYKKELREELQKEQEAV